MKLQTTLFCSLAAAALAMVSVAGAQTVILEEDFEGVADVAGILAKPMWNASDTGVEISTEQALNGSQSLRHDGVQTGFIRANFGQGYVAEDEGVGNGAILATGWLYMVDTSLMADSTMTLAGWSGDEWGDGDLQEFAVIGTYGVGPAVATHYATRVPFGGANWEGIPSDPVQAEAAEKIEGEWVQMAAFIESSEVSFYVNGNLIRNDNVASTAWDSFRIGSNAGNAPAALPGSVVYWDDIQVVQGASAPVPTNVNDWHLY